MHSGRHDIARGDIVCCWGGGIACSLDDQTSVVDVYKQAWRARPHTHTHTHARVDGVNTVYAK